MTARRLSFRVVDQPYTLHRAPVVYDADTPPRMGLWVIAGALSWAPLLAWWWL